MKLSPSFTIGTISIGTIEGASSVSFGNNFPTGFKNHKKHNQGFGNIFGDENDIRDILSQLDEEDVFEVFNQNDDSDNPDWLIKMMEQQAGDEDALNEESSGIIDEEMKE